MSYELYYFIHDKTLDKIEVNKKFKKNKIPQTRIFYKVPQKVLELLRSMNNLYGYPNDIIQGGIRILVEEQVEGFSFKQYRLEKFVSPDDFLLLMEVLQEEGCKDKNGKLPFRDGETPINHESIINLVRFILDKGGGKSRSQRKVDHHLHTILRNLHDRVSVLELAMER